MSSTYSPSLRIQLIDTGTELEAWGTPTDNNLGTIIEQAIVGSNTISLTNLTSYTLTTANAAVDQARNAVLVFNGALTANCNVIAPSVKKVYVVSNQTSGGKFVNIKTASGNAVNVINGTNQLVYCDGTDFKTAVNVNTIIGNLAVSGNSTVAGNVTIGGSITAANVLASSNGNITTNSNTSIVQLGNNTGAMVLPTGNTAQRPSTVKLGMQRWNTDLNWMEVWNGVVWYPLTGSYGVTYLVIAGGGGGNTGAGGGAGGTLVGGITVQSGTAYTITIGSGGAGAGSANAVQGSNTTALGFTAVGGGYAGGATGGNGGSGGGGSTVTLPSSSYAAGGSGVSGQGYAGGASGYNYVADLGGGGGGASEAGTVGINDTTGGNGGNGVSSSISGTLTYYAGGGYGRITGGSHAGQTGTAGLGANNYGGGGNAAQTTGGSGRNGVAIISYASAVQTATGGTVTSYTSGGTTYWVHTFTTSGTFTA